MQDTLPGTRNATRKQSNLAFMESTSWQEETNDSNIKKK